MQEFIRQSKLSIKEFSELYGIPYNTVRQWANGERKAPEWVKTFVKRLEKLQTKGEQIEIDIRKKYYLHYLNDELCYIYENIENAKKWQSFSKNVSKCKNTKITEITIESEKIIMEN